MKKYTHIEYNIMVTMEWTENSQNANFAYVVNWTKYSVQNSQKVSWILENSQTYSLSVVELLNLWNVVKCFIDKDGICRNYFLLCDYLTLITFVQGGR